jgi:hypothetical protein
MGDRECSLADEANTTPTVDGFKCSDVVPSAPYTEMNFPQADARERPLRAVNRQLPANKEDFDGC